MKDDYLIRAMTTNKEIRVLVARSTQVVKEAQQAHQTTPVATAALGRTLTAGALMGSMLKSGKEISLTIKGDGPLRKVVAHANQYGAVRGYVANSQIEFLENELGKLDVAKAIGQGSLTIKKDLGLKDPYQGSVPLVSGEIGDDLTYYFTKSEQTPSAVGLGVLVNPDCSVKAAGGFIIQLMPEAAEETIGQLEENLAEVESVSRLIEQGLSPEELLDKLLTGFEFKILTEREIEFKCVCGQERMKRLVSSLSEDDLREIIKEDEQVEVKCHFCNQNYQFSKEEIEDILASNQKEENWNLS
ncbi:Hsp33 family molecular chaperone HslO [Natroniella sulfidigena]|uniref:Hsp33 family molecular chaperone HslO n=1 Tax=Natroniella sulfidigena TaxID=723921 RepID=UPI00200A105B|nr:Hsp33 family molecular chaperone HslO [Natroniella sulfidigena]MCK8815889.1 Hsp33 family molecular chaperone HslO [Natroniella sulfidigena]